jgi:hypothetical protein
MSRADITIDQLIKDAVEGFLLDAHTQMRGNVVSYDEATKTCEVKLAAKRPVPDGEGGFVFQEIPNIPNVPVAWPSAGGFCLHWPLAAGDSVFLTFDEVDVQRWENTGEVCEPGWLERFGLSSPLAHPYSRAGVSGATGANMACPSPFSFGNPAAAKAVAIAEAVSARLDSIQAAFDTHTHNYLPGPGAAVPSLPPASPIGPLAPVAAAKLKAE